MNRFLDDQKEKHLRTAKRQQELTLETLELFGEMYMTLSLFPLLLIIILVMMGQVRTSMLYGTVYGLIPLIGAAFLVMVSTVAHDEPGDGYLEDASERRTVAKTGIGDFGVIEWYVGEYDVFDRIKRREETYETLCLFKHLHYFFSRSSPLRARSVGADSTSRGWSRRVLGQRPAVAVGLHQQPHQRDGDLAVRPVVRDLASACSVSRNVLLTTCQTILLQQRTTIAVQ